MDKDGDGKVTRAEFTGVPANFDRIDSNKDGALSKDEITRFFSARMAQAAAAALNRTRSRREDQAEAEVDAEVPPDPKPSRRRTLAARRTRQEGRSRKGEKLPNLAQRFKFLDKDGDGKISKGEFLREKLFDRLDANKDGFLSPEELAKFMKSEANARNARNAVSWTNRNRPSLAGTSSHAGSSLVQSRRRSVAHRPRRGGFPPVPDSSGWEGLSMTESGVDVGPGKGRARRLRTVAAARLRGGQADASTLLYLRYSERLHAPGGEAELARPVAAGRARTRSSSPSSAPSSAGSRRGITTSPTARRSGSCSW